MDSIVDLVATKKDVMESLWPREIENAYERIRPLGEGAFGIVWLARVKNREDVKARDDVADGDGDGDGDDDDDDESLDSFGAGEDSIDGLSPGGKGDLPAFVAIKQIATSREEDRKYAMREIAILSEICHPNIVRCLRYVEMPLSQLVVMTLADGPNLGDLVTVGGALSLSLARLAARQLISAVAYLHGRGKLYRRDSMARMLLF